MRYVIPIITGLAIAAAGLVPLMLLGPANLRFRPDLPWAAVATVVYLALLMTWLQGSGPPKSTSHHRRASLRLWPRAAPDTEGPSAGVLVALLAVLTVIWIAISRMSPVPDLSAYPTTSYRWSMFLMGGLTAGVVEEAAFRGYMQAGIERFDRANAIWITSVVFVLSHITHGVGDVLMLGPGMFAASFLYGLLARRTGTILPGMVIHVLGDLARVYFGVLHGDGSLLFVD